MKFKNILVTGAAGFIGSDFINLLLDRTESSIHVLDNLTYAANINIWNEFDEYPRVTKHKLSINNPIIENLIKTNSIDCIVNFAAESHVDNSISNPTIFYETNVLGTINLINIAKKFKIRFHQVSTDEVYGDLKIGSQDTFTIDTPLTPSSPYSSSKAAADLAVIAYGKTFNLNYTISRCGNNYGPNQNAEKMIPHSIHLILNKKKIEIYGDGTNVRDWIYVRDHNLAILKILSVGSHKTRIYNIGSENEINNLKIAELICKNLKVNFKENIIFVTDRQGHDKRYSIDPTTMHNIGWKPSTNFLDGIKHVVESEINKFNFIK